MEHTKAAQSARAAVLLICLSDRFLGQVAQIVEMTLTVAEVIRGNTHCIEHAQVQTGDRCTLRVPYMPPGAKGMRASGKQNGKIVVVMAIAVADAAAVHHHCFVEKS